MACFSSARWGRWDVAHFGSTAASVFVLCRCSLFHRRATDRVWDVPGHYFRNDLSSLVCAHAFNNPAGSTTTVSMRLWWVVPELSLRNGQTTIYPDKTIQSNVRIRRIIIENNFTRRHKTKLWVVTNETTSTASVGSCMRTSFCHGLQGLLGKHRMSFWKAEQFL